jgi:hypothetical protein
VIVVLFLYFVFVAVFDFLFPNVCIVFQIHLSEYW